jgi:hypothetical protein
MVWGGCRAGAQADARQLAELRALVRRMEAELAACREALRRAVFAAADAATTTSGGSGSAGSLPASPPSGSSDCGSTAGFASVAAPRCTPRSPSPFPSASGGGVGGDGDGGGAEAARAEAERLAADLDQNRAFRSALEEALREAQQVVPPPPPPPVQRLGRHRSGGSVAPRAPAHAGARRRFRRCGR